MTQYQLQDISPLIEASDLWAEDPSQPLWLKRDESGRISLARNQPTKLFADVVTIPDLADIPEDVSQLTVFVEWPSGRHRMQEPQSWAGGAPYEGRPYSLGTYDCYTIVRDWMERERGLVMEELSDSPERLIDGFLTDGAFVKNEELRNWERAIMPQEGDGILFTISSGGDGDSRQPNHCGVYLGDGTFLHHFPNRASCVEEFTPRWRSWVTSYMRRTE